MSIFNFFKRKEKGPTITDKIWMHQAAKERACIQMTRENPKLTFIAWSSLTYDHFKQLLNRKYQLSVRVLLASDILPSRIADKEIVFWEHHFSRPKEQELLKALKKKNGLFLNSLDDPIASIHK